MTLVVLKVPRVLKVRWQKCSGVLGVLVSCWQLSAVCCLLLQLL
ncbi:MAG: hypothetical protein H6Q10_1410 [Acidobacteria bacterium]|jgi:hypothetical protein|nr:hypothetical protein [Acidobacteriota bacterium]